MEIIRYSSQYKAEWNATVKSSANGTFLHNRDFMDYHKDRFEDVSLLFVHKNKIKGVLPANLKGENVYSHGGLTYGGLIWPAATSSQDVAEMLQLTTEYYAGQMHASNLYYKAVPYIYHSYPSSQDLYFLTQKGATLLHRTLSSTILIQKALPFSKLRQRHMRKAEKMGLSIRMDDNPATWQKYWVILSTVLRDKHQKTPVHSLQEILLLKSHFAKEIRLLTVVYNDTLIAGTVLFLTSCVIHAQYIAANEMGREMGALDMLFDYILHSSEYQQYAYLDFGISTENEGRCINHGLLFQKEGFGARGVCYDEYLLKL